MFSSLVMMITVPTVSRPLLPARPLIWMYSPIFIEHQSSQLKKKRDANMARELKYTRQEITECPAVMLPCILKDNSSSWHVDSHSKRFGCEQHFDFTPTKEDLHHLSEGGERVFSMTLIVNLVMSVEVFSPL